MSDPTAPAPERTACCGDHCTATATHGPGAFPVACWQHAGDWPEIPAPPPSEAPPSCPTGYTCEGCGAKHAPEEIGATGGQCGACGRVMGGPPSDPSPPESAPPVAKPVALGPIVIGTIPAVPEIRTREEFEALMERGQLPPEAPAGTRGGDCDHPMSHRMYKQDGVTGVCGRCGSVLSPSAPSPAREPAAEVTVEQLVSAISTRALGGAALLNEDAARRALGAVDDNMLRRMLAAVEGGT